MITWIQRSFQQHFRIIFGILLVLIIVSFIFVTNASSGLGRTSHTYLTLFMFGASTRPPPRFCRCSQTRKGTIL